MLTVGGKVLTGIFCRKVLVKNIQYIYDIENVLINRKFYSSQPPKSGKNNRGLLSELFLQSWLYKFDENVPDTKKKV